MRKVAMQDIADKLGISKGTVSLVLRQSQREKGKRGNVRKSQANCKSNGLSSK